MLPLRTEGQIMSQLSAMESPAVHPAKTPNTVTTAGTTVAQLLRGLIGAGRLIEPGGA